MTAFSAPSGRLEAGLGPLCGWIWNTGMLSLYTEHSYHQVSASMPKPFDLHSSRDDDFSRLQDQARAELESGG